jgi:hypothetical protein|tara:strand:- start:821 stop:1360 length:540 start_codon:yes stop_codon:yes gene_type:complete
MQLLTITDNVAMPSAYTLTIQEFAKLVSRDKTKAKDRSSKELAYVYFVCDHASPFAVYGEDKRGEEVKLSVFGETKWEPDSAIEAACAKYKKLKETSAVRLLAAARESVVKLENYFKDVDLTLADDNGKPIFSAKDLVANLSKMGDVINGISKLEDLVKKEEQVQSSNRGGVEVNKYSQ